MRSLNIAARRFGKTTICIKRFLDALDKDPQHVCIILPHPYNIAKISYHMTMTNNKFIESFHIIRDAYSLRGKDINKLFVDDYDAWFISRKGDDIFSTIPYVEAWSSQFLTRAEFSEIMEIRRIRKHSKSLSERIPETRFGDSFISWQSTKLLVHRKSNEDKLLNSLLSAGSSLI